MYSVLNMGYKPHEFAELPQKEKAFVMACIDKKIENEKREIAKIKNNKKRR